MAVFVLEDAHHPQGELGQTFVVGLYVSSIKTDTGRIIRQDELSSVVRRRAKEGSSHLAG